MSDTSVSLQPSTGMRTFTTVWLGQLISVIGTGLTAFSLSLWVYDRTKSITTFALVLLCSALPEILVAPFAGLLVDRLNRRLVMIISDSLSAMTTLALALLLFSDQIAIWHVYVIVLLNATFNTCHGLAYSSIAPLLVPKEQLGRASGMVEFAQALAQLIAPILAGSLFALIGLQGVLLIDMVSFLVALSMLLVVSVPRQPRAADSGAGGTFLRDILYGWRYTWERSGLLVLLLYLATANFLIEVAYVLLTPLVRSFASTTVLGTILSVGGIGYLVGSVLLSLWKNPRRRMPVILGAVVVAGLAISLIGLLPNPLLVGAGVFLAFCGLATAAGSSQVIWQTKVPLEVQGRVFAFRRMFLASAVPLSYLIAGPLAERVFEPLLLPGGALAGSLGSLIGVGPGRGTGLFFVVIGAIFLPLTLAAYLHPRLFRLEEELPDYGAPAES